MSCRCGRLIVGVIVPGLAMPSVVDGHGPPGFVHVCPGPAGPDSARCHAIDSWGASEFAGETGHDGHFSQPGVSVFVSSGDNGTPAGYPSSSPNVISVGGTTLSTVRTPSFGETGWSGSGGGCSACETAHPTPSTASVNGGGRRATPDVSLDADPASGVSVYDSTRYRGQAGWFALGGTSASAPMWAGRAAASGAVVDAALIYGTSIAFRDITIGNNGASALPGFDLVTGRGSWTGATP